jgi:gamma-glutamyltranspeptidase/glutathione hydrolase
MDVLRRGGNAIDAAITVSAVMCVTGPAMSHLGGDGFALVRTAAGETLALNSGGRAPLAATPEAYPNGIPRKGASAVAVPGLVDAWYALHGRLGSRPLAELLAPAAGLARDGFAVSHPYVRALRGWAEVLASDPGCKEVFLADGVPTTGTVLRQSDLARTLEAGAICEHLARDGGLLTLEDLARDQAVWSEPLHTSYRGRRVFGQPLPTQGFMALEALNIIEGFDLASMPLASADAVHVTAESVRLVFSDRQRYAGDPDFVDVPMERLLSKEHAAELRARIDARRAGAAVPPSRGDTTSFAVADGEGNAVSFIQSVYQPWGAGVLVPGTGVLLNDRMWGFSLDSSSPNVLAPGKRTVHTLNTWLLENADGSLYAGGTPRADFQVQTNVQVLTSIADWGLNPQAAIDAPKWVLTTNAELALEGRFPYETVAGLSERGHAIISMPAWAFTFCHHQVQRWLGEAGKKRSWDGRLSPLERGQGFDVHCGRTGRPIGRPHDVLCASREADLGFESNGGACRHRHRRVARYRASGGEGVRGPRRVRRRELLSEPGRGRGAGRRDRQQRRQGDRRARRRRSSGRRSGDGREDAR